MKKLFVNSVVVAVSVLFSLIAVEAAMRVISDVELFSTRNLITSKSHLLNVHTVNDYDPVLGWRLKEDVVSGGFNTGVLGLRHTRTAPDLENAKILAVGDSFTAGSEVVDGFSWPAHLEDMLGQQVLNAGVGAYGTGQIVLRAEQMLEHTDPEIVIVGFLENDIYRAEYEIYGGGPKPFFTVEDGKLVEHNIPVPRNIRHGSEKSRIARWLGYSATATRIIESFAPEMYLSFDGPIYRRIGNDPVEVSCLLLKRFAEKARARDIRLIHLMQYGGGLISTMDEPNVEARAVMQCAHSAGYQVVDEFSALRKVYEENPEELKDYYVMADEGRVYGHMSSQGNQLVAGLVRLAIENPGVSVTDERFDEEISLLRETVESDGINMIDFEVVKPWLANVKMFDEDEDATSGEVYRLMADAQQTGGEAAEHYLNTGILSSIAGPHVASVYVNPLEERYIRFQLLDSNVTGLIADFDLQEETVFMNRRTTGRTDAWLEKQDNGWYRLAISTDLETDRIYAILQFMKSGTTAFEANDDSFKFSGFRLERGDVPAD